MFRHAAAAIILVAVFPQVHAQSSSEIRAERIALGSRPDFNAADLMEAEGVTQKEAMSLWQKGKPVEAYNKLQGLLAKYPNSVAAHSTLARLLKDLKSDPKAPDVAVIAEKAAFHAEKARLIEDSIIGGTQCQTAADDCRVLTWVEIYFAIGRLGGKIQSDKLETVEGRPYKVVTAKGDDGKTKAYYFEVSAFPPEWRK
ncbi:hypothetical protein BurJ1DRAFT_1912 [Burkholderiales bacterium JOSHI_001]|nr:hypothetical protein BurJ1DRAFT_1912 [Burkholderiales bacterium JOSHI_001]